MKFDINNITPEQVQTTVGLADADLGAKPATSKPTFNINKITTVDVQNVRNTGDQSKNMVNEAVKHNPDTFIKQDNLANQFNEQFDSNITPSNVKGREADYEQKLKANQKLNDNVKPFFNNIDNAIIGQDDIETMNEIDLSVNATIQQNVDELQTLNDEMFALNNQIESVETNGYTQEEYEQLPPHAKRAYDNNPQLLKQFQFEKKELSLKIDKRKKFVTEQAEYAIEAGLKPSANQLFVKVGGEVHQTVEYQKRINQDQLYGDYRDTQVPVSINEKKTRLDELSATIESIEKPEVTEQIKQIESVAQQLVEMKQSGATQDELIPLLEQFTSLKVQYEHEVDSYNNTVKPYTTEYDILVQRPVENDAWYKSTIMALDNTPERIQLGAVNFEQLTSEPDPDNHPGMTRDEFKAQTFLTQNIIRSKEFKKRANELLGYELGYETSPAKQPEIQKEIYDKLLPFIGEFLNDDQFEEFTNLQQGVGKKDAELAESRSDLEDQLWLYNTEQGSFSYYSSSIIAAASDMVAPIAAGALTKNPATSLALMTAYAGGSTYGELLKRDDLTTEQRVTYTNYMMLAEMMTEVIPVSKILKPSDADGLISKITGTAVFDGAGEVIVEGVAIGMDMGILDDSVPINEAMTRLIDAGVIGIGTSGAIVLATDAAITKYNQPTLDQMLSVEIESTSSYSEAEQQQIDAIVGNVEKMQMKNKSPEKMREFMQSVNKSDTTVFIDPVQLSLFLKEKTPEEIQNDPGLTALQNSLRETTGMVEMTVADFSVDMVGSEYMETIRPMITMREDSISQSQKDQVEKLNTEYQNRMVERAKAEVELNVESQKALELVTKQLIDTGVMGKDVTKASAEVVTSWLTIQSLEQNKTPTQILEESGFAVQGPQTGVDAVLTEREKVFEQSQLKDLMVVHNLSGENLAAANKLGGLAAPSIGIVRDNVSEFDSFGDITLIAKPELLNDPDARTFGADVYSPRQPRSSYKIDNKAFVDFSNTLDNEDRLLRRLDDPEQLKDQGADAIVRNESAQNTFLKSINKAPKLKKLKVSPTVKALMNVPTYNDLLKNKKALKAVTDNFNEQINDTISKMDRRSEIKGEQLVGEEMRDELTNVYFNEDGTPSKELTQSLFSDRDKIIRSPYDAYQYKRDLNSKFNVKKTKAEFEKWAETEFNKMVTGEQFFKGFTNSGNKRYSDYTLENIVNEMTRTIRAGEGTFYGVGSVRSGHAKEFKTIEQVKKNREKIVSTEDLAIIKQDSESMFENALNDLKPFYKFDATSWGYSEDAGSAIAKGGRELTETFNMNAKARGIINELTSYLSDLPTEYFETKMQRAMHFSEFDTAVVPKGTDKAVVKILRDAGVKVKMYGGDVSRADVMGKQKKLMFQEARGTFNPAAMLINLTNAADESTFMHEFAHFMYQYEKNKGGEVLDEMHAWIKRIGDDVAMEANGYLKKGIVSIDDLNEYLDDNVDNQDVSDAFERAIHEHMARGFEKYLMEGEAPSVALRPTFAKFARWLTRLYQNALETLGVKAIKLDDPMREVFDLMLATEEQVTRARMRSRVEPFTPNGQAVEDITNQYNSVEDKQVETLRDKLIKELRRTKTEQWKKERDEIAETETLKLSEQQNYLTIAQLETGDLKLNYNEMIDLYSTKFTNKKGEERVMLNPKLRKMTAKKAEPENSLPSDTFAEMFDYTSGDAMIKNILNTRSIEVVAVENAEKIMTEKYGDILNDGSIEREADDAVRDEEYGRLLLNELKALKPKSQRSIEHTEMKYEAERIVASIPFNKLRPQSYRKLEIEAAQSYKEAEIDNNKDAMTQFKSEQARMYYIGREATRVKAEFDKGLKFVKRFDKTEVRKELNKAGSDFLAQIDKVLSKFEFKKSAVLRDFDKVQGLQEWMDAMNTNEGATLNLPNIVTTDAFGRRHWKTLPYSEFKAVIDALTNMEYQAKYLNTMVLRGQKVDFKEAVAELSELIEVQPKIKDINQQVVNESPSFIGGAIAGQVKIQTYSQWLDGNELGGTFYDYMVAPHVDAFDKKQKLAAEISKTLSSKLETFFTDNGYWLNKDVLVPELVSEQSMNNGTMNGGNLMAVVLNTGNMGNLRKMLLGEGWETNEDKVSINHPAIQAVMKHMTPERMEVIQLIWDTMDSLFPMLQEVNKQTTGLTVAKVEASEIKFQGQTYRGGYYPVVYDQHRSKLGDDNDAKTEAQAQGLMAKYGRTVAVSSGATNERTGVTAPINFNLGLINNHFNETIQYIAYHAAVRQTNKLLQNFNIKKLMKERLGLAGQKAFENWLTFVAEDGKSSKPKQFTDTILNNLRKGQTLVTMGYKVGTILMQGGGFFTPAYTAGQANTLNAVRTVYGRGLSSIQESVDFAMSQSKVLPHRRDTMTMEIMDVMNRLTKNEYSGIASKFEDEKTARKVAKFFKGFNTFQKYGLWAVGFAQFYGPDLVTWYAHYNKSMKNHDDVSRAVSEADEAVELFQGSGSIHNQAGFYNAAGGFEKNLLMFMTFFSSLFNIQATLARGVKNKEMGMKDVLSYGVYMTLLPTLYEMLVTADTPDESDDETWAELILLKSTLYNTTSIPFVKDIVSGTLTDYGYNISPTASMISGMTDIAKSILNGNDINDYGEKALLRFMGVLLQVPGTNQVLIMKEHIREVTEGEESFNPYQLFVKDLDD